MHVPLTPIRALYRAVDLFGRKIGVVSGDRRFTYAEFGERVERLAFGLLSEGVAPGDRVAFLSFNTHQLLEGYFGVPLVRAIVMPLNVRLTAAELTGILCHAEPRVVIYEADFAPVAKQLRAGCPGVQTWIEIGPAYDELLQRGRIARPDIFTFDERDIAELFYTSGSTGTPKGVTLSHRTLYMHMLSISATFYNDETMVELHTIPLFHANGWGRPQCATLHGLKQVMVRRFEPVHVLRLIQEEKATSMSLVPTMANALVHCAELANYDHSSLRQIHLGGAASSPELIERLEAAFHCPAMAGYGLTETSPAATSARDKSTLPEMSEPERIRRRAMTGWPLPGCEIRVVDLQMKDVPRDMESIGEIVMRGDIIMDGYFREPKATADVMTNGWLHTGDMAMWDEENYLHIVDRKKDIIISGGENISSIEVERAIASHPAVLECAVVSAPDPQWGEVPATFVTVKPGYALDECGLCEYLQGRIAKFKMPRRFHFSDTALPKTGTGKILKRELREKLWSNKDLRIQG
uniref:AMP-dependent synthetase and ligase n=1 Tax=Solibacter usitatus (strain Ellin6076) TaxID=234267 RepID=Q01WM6_SOLUE